MAVIVEPAAPDHVVEAANELTFRNVITVNVMLKKQNVTHDTWLYVHDRNILFGRFHEPKNWSKDMVPGDEAGFAGFGHPEPHLQIEGKEVTGSPGLISMFIGQHSKRLKVGRLSDRDWPRLAQAARRLYDGRLPDSPLVATFRGLHVEIRPIVPKVLAVGGEQHRPIEARLRGVQGGREGDGLEEDVDLVRMVTNQTPQLSEALPPLGIIVGPATAAVTASSVCCPTAG